jgi:hypothetical protein
MQRKNIHATTTISKCNIKTQQQKFQNATTLAHQRLFL